MACKSIMIGNTPRLLLSQPGGPARQRSGESTMMIGSRTLSEETQEYLYVIEIPATGSALLAGLNQWPSCGLLSITLIQRHCLQTLALQESPLRFLQIFGCFVKS